MSTDERPWRKLKRIERTEHKLWPVLQRALRDHLLRLPDDLDGVIFRDSTRPLDDLIVALGTHRGERKVVRSVLERLMSDGYLVHDGHALRIRNFEREQSNDPQPVTDRRSKDAKRKAEKRAKERAERENAEASASGVSTDVSGQLSADTENGRVRKSPRPREEEEKDEDVLSADAARTDTDGHDIGVVRIGPNWEPSTDQVANLTMGGAVPEAAVPQLIAAFRSINMGKVDKLESWDRSWGRWAPSEWRKHPEAYRKPRGGGDVEVCDL